MAQETETTTLAQTAVTSESLAATSAAATNFASQMAPPVGKSLSAMTKDERDSAVAAKLQERKAAASAAAGQPKETPAEVAPSTAAATTVEPAAEAKPEPAPAATPEVDPAAEHLLKLARDSQRLARDRREFREEKARENAAAEASRASQAAAQERLAKLEQARASGNELQLLRAAGLSEDQIRGPLVINLLDQLKKEEEFATGAVQPGLSREQVQEIVRAQQEESERKALAKQQEELQASIAARRNEFFGKVAVEFKSGQYPLVAAVKPTHAELDSYFVAHHQQTGEALSAAQLLAAFETRYREQGLTVVPKPKPGQKPSKPATAAATHTIGARATSDAGDIPLTTEPKKPRTASEIREEGKAKALAFLESKHASRGH